LAELISVTDGRISIRSPQLDGIELPCADNAGPPAGPVGVVSVAREIAGWVSYDGQLPWLGPGDVLLRYGMEAQHGSRGLAFRAVQLLLHHLATRTEHRTAMLEVRPGDRDALEVASAAGFVPSASTGGGSLFSRSVPPVSYTDGVVTIRRQRPDDIDRHLEAIDSEQIDWLWAPGDRQKWEALTPDQQRARNLHYLQAVHESFGAGPKWTFSADRADAPYVAYVDCDLANDHVPAGDANIAYTGHPSHRGQGNVSRAVRLIIQFLREHTGAQTAHIIVDAQNIESLRVARAVSAADTERWRNEHGRTMVRHVLSLR
jgi:RimJ/RimL family protein N-acetyltransferase